MNKPKISQFPNEILEHIAGIIADTRSGSEITRFYNSAGYPEFVLAFASLLMARLDEAIRTSNV